MSTSSAWPPGEKIRVAVAVHFQNEATSPGIKRGGVLNVVRHTVEVLADPDSVPEAFTADLGALDINDNVRWADLQGTEGVALADRRPRTSWSPRSRRRPSRPSRAADADAPRPAAAPAKGAGPGQGRRRKPAAKK